FRSRLGQLSAPQRRDGSGPVDRETAAEIDRVRGLVRQHPCHRCPDREAHARSAEKALQLERDNDRTTAKMQSRTNTIAQRFDRICLVLESFGHLTEGGEEVTAAGRMLSRIYNELDLVTAECIRAGVFDGLDAPQLGAVLSTLVYEARRTDDFRRPPRMPDGRTADAVDAVRRIAREVSLAERDARLPSARDLDLGLARAVFDWSTDEPLASVLDRSGLTAGDFVRWMRQVVDFADQVGIASGESELRATCRELVASVRRGVVDFTPDEVDPDTIIQHGEEPGEG